MHAVLGAKFVVIHYAAIENQHHYQLANVERNEDTGNLGPTSMHSSSFQDTGLFGLT